MTATATNILTPAVPARMGELLIERGYLQLDQLRAALERQHENGKAKLLGETLVDLGCCTEDQIIECLAAEYDVPYAKLEQRLFDPKVIDLIDRQYIEKNLVLPLFCIRGVLTIAVSEPTNVFLTDELEGVTGKKVQIVASTPRTFAA